MEIANIVKISLVDMPGYISCVLFCQGCNRHCSHCQNKDLIGIEPGAYTWHEIMYFLKERQNIIQGVVFSGGEPTIQPDLLEKVQIVKEMGFKIGLHTNGDGVQFPLVAKHCDYILLSQHNPLKIDIGLRADHLDISTVLKSQDGEYYNNIRTLKRRAS